MKEFLRNFFFFSSLERKGVLVLIIIILLVTAVNFYLAYHNPHHEYREDEALVLEIQEFEKQLKLIKQDESKPDLAVNHEPSVVHELFYFDPNHVSAFDLRRLGLDEMPIRNLLKYRKKGGHFYRKDDLKKIYGLDPWQYEQLAPYITINDKSDIQAGKTIVFGNIRKDPVNINLADTADLEKLSGIGPVLARRIVRYRSLLGGFYTVQQLREVYGITDSLLNAIKASVYADTTMINKINLNLAGENDLAKHPYIGWHTARGIVKYRAGVSQIKSLEELKTNGLIMAKELERLKKYLMI